MNKEYRILKEGEIVLITDEIYDDDLKSWRTPRNSVGDKAPSPLYTCHRIFRRRVETEGAKEL